METELSVVYKIAERASEIAITRFRMPRNIYTWLYGFAYLSRYSTGRINIEFPEDAKEVEKQLRKLCAFFLACKKPPFSIKMDIEKVIREKRYDLLPKITGEPESDIYIRNQKTMLQTDLYDNGNGWNAFLDVTELVQFLCERANENGNYFFNQFTHCVNTIDETDPKIEDQIHRPWENDEFTRILKNEDFDPPQPGTDEFKVVTANRIIPFYSRTIEVGVSEDENESNSSTYYDALFAHEFMSDRLKRVASLVGYSDTEAAQKKRYDTTLKIYKNMLSSRYVNDEEKYAIRFEMDSFIKDEHLVNNTVKQMNDEFSLDDLKQGIIDEMRLNFDVKLEKLRHDMREEFYREYLDHLSEKIRAEVKELLPDLFIEPEKPKEKPYKVYRSESYSYAHGQLMGTYDTYEEAKKDADAFNDNMEEMRGSYTFDMRDYATAYVVGPDDKK